MRLTMTMTLLLFTAMTTACASSGFSSNYIPQGTRVVQKKPVAIPAGETRVYLQYGQITTHSKMNKYEAFCHFEVNQLSTETAQEINPGNYEVSAVVLDMRLEMSKATFNYLTKFRLHAPDNPNIREMECGNWATPDVGNYLSISLMQQALGSYFDIVLPK